MRVLVVHARYRQRGGEDLVVDNEVALLNGHGIDARLFEAHNEDLEKMSALRAGAQAIWNRDACRSIADAIENMNADVVHVHNTFPVLSPAVIRAAHRSGAAVVHTLHNYRIGCPSAQLLRDGVHCELCLERRIPTPAIRYRCFHNSTARSAMAAGVVAVHRAFGTWTHDVDAFIAVSQAQRNLMITAGLPASRMHVRAHFLPDASIPEDPGEPGASLLYVGRLSPEKGVDVLINAAASAAPEIIASAGPGNTSPLEVVIAGDGPQRKNLELAARAAELSSDHRVRFTFLGHCSADELNHHRRDARAIVIPSVWQEPFGMVAIEAAAHARPVIAARSGALPEIVEEDTTGLIVEPGNVQDCAAAITRLFTIDELALSLGAAARTRCEARYTAGPAIESLRVIYGLAIEARQSSRTHQQLAGADR